MGLMNFQNSTHTLRLNSQCRNRPQRAHFSISIAKGGSEQNPLFRPCGLPVSSIAERLTCVRQPGRFVSRCGLRRHGLASTQTFVRLVMCARHCGWSYQAEKNLVFLSQRALLEAYLIEGKIQDFARSGRRPEDLFAFSGTEGLRRGLQSER